MAKPDGGQKVTASSELTGRMIKRQSGYVRVVGNRMLPKAGCVNRGDPERRRDSPGSQNLRSSEEAPVIGVERRQGRKVDS